VIARFVDRLLARAERLLRRESRIGGGSLPFENRMAHTVPEGEVQKDPAQALVHDHAGKAFPRVAGRLLQLGFDERLQKLADPPLQVPLLLEQIGQAPRPVLRPGLRSLRDLLLAEQIHLHPEQDEHEIRFGFPRHGVLLPEAGQTPLGTKTPGRCRSSGVSIPAIHYSTGRLLPSTAQGSGSAYSRNDGGESPRLICSVGWQASLLVSIEAVCRGPLAW